MRTMWRRSQNHCELMVLKHIAFRFAWWHFFPKRNTCMLYVPRSQFLPSQYQQTWSRRFLKVYWMLRVYKPNNTQRNSKSETVHPLIPSREHQVMKHPDSSTLMTQLLNRGTFIWKEKNKFNSLNLDCVTFTSLNFEKTNSSSLKILNSSSADALWQLQTSAKITLPLDLKKHTMDVFTQTKYLLLNITTTSTWSQF